MPTWRRRGPEGTWPSSRASATPQRALTAWRPWQLPLRLPMHRWGLWSSRCSPFILHSSFHQQRLRFVSQVHGPASQHVSNSTVSTPAPVLSRRPVVEEHHEDYRKEVFRKGKCLSIGIQVFGRSWKTVKTLSILLWLLICTIRNAISLCSPPGGWTRGDSRSRRPIKVHLCWCSSRGQQRVRNSSIKNSRHTGFDKVFISITDCPKNWSHHLFL